MATPRGSGTIGDAIALVAVLFAAADRGEMVTRPPSSWIGASQDQSTPSCVGYKYHSVQPDR